MNQKMSVKKMLFNGLLFLTIIVFTFRILFQNQDIPQIMQLLKQVNLKFVGIGVLCGLVFVSCEGVNICRALKLFGYHPKKRNCLKYAAAGFFFSSITPSSTGGQPMQLCYMYKDEIKIAHGSLALLLELACYQFVTVMFAIIAYVYNFNFFEQMNGTIQFFLFFGIALNVTLLFLVLSSIFSKRISNVMLRMVEALIRKFKFRDGERKILVLGQQFEEYQESAIYIKENKGVIVRMCLTTLVQILAIHSIPYFVYLAMGQHGFGYFTVLSLQAVLHITVAALPLPGAVGVSESGFMVLYQLLYSKGMIGSALLLSRGISFYLLLIFCGVLLLIQYMISGNKRKSKTDKLKKEKSHEYNPRS